MAIFVVIPHYIVTDELEQLAKNTIQSYRDTGIDVHIISVDDGSPMNTAFLKEMSDSYVRNEQNSGFAITCNNGIKHAINTLKAKQDDYIIISNNDIEINAKALMELQRPFTMFDNVAFVGIPSFKVKEVDGRPLDRFNMHKMTEGGLISDWMQDGGLICTTRAVIDRIGMYDERFIRGGYEDVDWFLRARDTFGMRIVMNGCAGYYHVQGATRWNCEKNDYINDFGRESKDIESENLRRFIDKWGFNPHRGQIWKNTDLFNE